MPNSAHERSFRKLVDYYEQCVNMKWRLHAGEVEDLLETAVTRDEIHNQLAKVGREAQPELLDRIKQIDSNWINYVLSTRDPSFTIGWHKPHERFKWWFWLDQLDTLTPEERSTL